MMLQVRTLALLGGMLLCSPLRPLSEVRAESAELHHFDFLDNDQQPHELRGKLLVEAQDGGVLLQARDGRLWTIPAKNLKKKTATGEPFRFYTAQELGERLQAEYGRGFLIETTEHYLICTNAGPVYAKWCAALFERLYDTFQTHWRHKPLELSEPEMPLVAIIFANQQQYAQASTDELGPSAASSLGHYSVTLNRILLFDLTAGPNSRPARNANDILQKLQVSPFNAATVVHEATHQIAFNTGMHQKYADNPLWLTEGMAMYFETPDLRSRRGWNTVGKVNPFRIKPFQEYARKRRPSNSLQTLLVSNERLQSEETAADAYSEAWALTYFLIKTRRDDYTSYLHRISQKPPLIFDTPEKRLEEFQAVFGDLEQLDRDFLRYTLRLSP